MARIQTETILLFWLLKCQIILVIFNALLRRSRFFLVFFIYNGNNKNEAIKNGL